MVERSCSGWFCGGGRLATVRRSPRPAWVALLACSLQAGCTLFSPSDPSRVDSDRDGVGDRDDRCPDARETINGIEDGDGCPDEGAPRVVYEDGEIVLLDPIRFASGSSRLEGPARSLLDQVALTLRAHPEIGHMRVEGHTDDTGTREFNMELSQRRASVVRAYLVERGVDGERLSVESYGPDRPVRSGRDERARAKNRRVEFVLE